MLDERFYSLNDFFDETVTYVRKQLFFVIFTNFLKIINR